MPQGTVRRNTGRHVLARCRRLRAENRRGRTAGPYRICIVSRTASGKASGAARSLRARPPSGGCAYRSRSLSGRRDRSCRRVRSAGTREGTGAGTGAGQMPADTCGEPEQRPPPDLAMGRTDLRPDGRNRIGRKRAGGIPHSAQGGNGMGGMGDTALDGGSRRGPGSRNALPILPGPCRNHAVTLPRPCRDPMRASLTAFAGAGSRGVEPCRDPAETSPEPCWNLAATSPLLPGWHGVSGQWCLPSLFFL